MRLNHKVRDMKPGETMDRVTVEPGMALMAKILRDVSAALVAAGHDPIFVHVGLTVDVDVVVRMPKEGTDA